MHLPLTADLIVVADPPQTPGRRRSAVPGARADLRMLGMRHPATVQVDMQRDEGRLLVEIFGPQRGFGLKNQEEK